MRFAAIATGLIFLCACSTYSKKQCQEMDWSREGANFATRGFSPEEARAHFKTKCADEHGVAVDETRFADGFEKGLDALCTEEGGERLGKSGARYKGTCERRKEDVFLKRYHSARENFLEKEIRRLESQVSDLESEVSSLRGQVSNLESQVSACRASP